MSPEQVIAAYGLVPHPEGEWFREFPEHGNIIRPMTR